MRRRWIAPGGDRSRRGDARAGLLAGCGRGRRRRRPARSEPQRGSTSRSTSTSTPTTPGSSRRSSRASSGRRASTSGRGCPRTPPRRSSRSPRAGGPGGLVRARGAARRGPGPRRRLGGGRSSSPAHLADLAARGRNRDAAADLDGKTVGTAGIPYQSDYLETILEDGRTVTGRRRRGERRFQPAACADRRPGRRDPRRLPEHRGGRPAPPRPRPADHPG